jgi:phosphatidylserine/phosphatidylglycerophosphate/cardiolipin synthase-like enzyme
VLFFVVALILAYVFFWRHSPSGILSFDRALIPAQIIEIDDSFSGEFYFNTEFGTSVLSDTVIHAIDSATTRVELAMYSMDHLGIRSALYRAAERGVRVTMLLAAEQVEAHDRVFSSVPSYMTRVDIGTSDSRGSMHHKFMIVDRGLPHGVLLFGSYNFTALQEKFDPSFLLRTTRPEIVTLFGSEFDRMVYINDSPTPSDRNPYIARIEYPEGYLEVWFSPGTPEVSLRDRMQTLIAGSRSHLEGMIWNFTDESIARSFLDRAMQGLPVTLLTDDYTYAEQDSVVPALVLRASLMAPTLRIITDASRGLEIENRYGGSTTNSFLHHHLLLIDRAVALFGTSNWSANGFWYNDESTMVSNIPMIVASLGDAFDLNYSKATQ